MKIRHMSEIKPPSLCKTLFGFGSVLLMDSNSVIKFVFSFSIYTQNIQVYASILFALYLFCDIKFLTAAAAAATTTTTTLLWLLHKP
jgi:hypothetical protein